MVNGRWGIPAAIERVKWPLYTIVVVLALLASGLAASPSLTATAADGDGTGPDQTGAGPSHVASESSDAASEPSDTASESEEPVGAQSAQPSPEPQETESSTTEPDDASSSAPPSSELDQEESPPPSDRTDLQPADDDGGVVVQNVENPVSLNSKNVDPASTLEEPLRPGDDVVYTLNYSCSSLATGGNCNDATLTDVLPIITDVDGNPLQLEFVSVNALTPSHWTFTGLAGDHPDQQLGWDANVLPAGASGALIITLRIPEGVVPALPEAQDFSNTAAADFPDLETTTVTSPVSYVNALPPSSTIAKSGPDSALLSAAGTGPVAYTITICPGTDSVHWDEYVVTDTLPLGATISGPLPFGGVFTPDPDVDPQTGGTIEWQLDAANRPAPDDRGCLDIEFAVEFVNATSGGDESNVVGEDKTNMVGAVGSDGDNSQEIGPAETTLTLTGPQTRFGPSKTARNGADTRNTYYVEDGESILYRVGASNTSDPEAVPFTTATLVDGPLPAEFTLTEVRTGTWTGAVDDVTAEIQVSTDSTNGQDGTWTTVATGPNVTVNAGLAGVDWVRWVFTSVGDPAIGPGWSTSGLALVGTVNGVTAPDDASVELDNCAALTGLQGGQTQNRGSRCDAVLLEYPQPHPSIAKSNPPTLEPGETITTTLTVGNNIDATGPLAEITLTDCVPDAPHLEVHDVDPGTDWQLVAAESFVDCTPVTGPPNNGTVGTQLVLEYIGAPLQPGQNAPAVTYQITANSYDVPVEGSEPAPPGVRRNRATLTDGADEPFVHCVQANCQATANTTIPFRAELESGKLVRGTLDSHFNVAGTTTPGGQVTWQIQVENRGNVEVENVQLVDVFPHVGDTGVRLLQQPRGSEYAPLLVGLIDAPGWTVEYSRSSNPCRDEVLSPADTPHAGCDAPEWTTTPDLLDLPAYRSIRLTLDGRLGIGESAVFEWDMVTPIDDGAYAEGGAPRGRLDDCTIPVSDPPYPDNPGASELDRESSATPTCPIANNSFAYGVSIPADQLGGLPDPGRLGAEPPQVAVHVAADSTGHVVGGVVWSDHDNDGIREAGEDLIPGTRVDLYDASDPANPTYLATTFTDVEGRYLFDDLPDGDYLVRFYLPDDEAYVSPPEQDGVEGDQGAGSNSHQDSNVPQAPSGTDGIGNYYDTAVITLGDDAVDGRESDLSWDAGIWLPEPAISIDKRTKDDDWTDVEAGDGVTILQDRAVTWLYRVENTGNTYLTGLDLTDAVTTPPEGVLPPASIDCLWSESTDAATPDDVLAPGEVVTCRASGVAIVGEYVNEATTTGVPAQFPSDDGGTTVYEPIDKVGVPTEVDDDDPSSYTGLVPSIELDKVTDGSLYDESTGALAPAGPGDGITVTAGLGVQWTYTVTNPGTVALGNVVLVDDAGTPADPADDVTVSVSSDPTTPGALTVTGIAPDQVVLTGDDGDGILQVDEVWTFTIAGEAVLGAYANDAVVTAVAVDEADGSPLVDPEDPRGQVEDDDPSDYTGTEGPAIQLEKATNGQDADAPTGPYVSDGEPVIWTLEVTNTGTVPLVDVVVTDPLIGGEVCLIDVLPPGATHDCEPIEGVRFGPGQQRNDAEVAGTPSETTVPPNDPDDPDTWSTSRDDYETWPDADPVVDEDPSHHYGADPGIDLEKATNGVDADTSDEAVAVGPGQPVTWTFVVTNTGNTDLADVAVTDLVTAGEGADGAVAVAVDCPSDTLAVGEEMTCTAEGVAGGTDHANLGEVTARPVDETGEPTDEVVDDEDPSHYRIGEADLWVTKQALDPLEGGAEMRWLLRVGNDGPDDAPPGTVVVDRLPTELTYVSASDNWTCATSGADGQVEVTCELAEAIAVGETVDLVLVTRVTDGADAVENAAAVLGVFRDVDPDNDADVAAIEVGQEPVDPPAPPAPGGQDPAPAPSPLPLPRTGSDLALLALVAAAAILTGALMVRRGRRRGWRRAPDGQTVASRTGRR